MSRIVRAPVFLLIAIVAVLSACAIVTAKPNKTEPSASNKQTTGSVVRQRQPYTIAFGGDVHFEGGLRARLATPEAALGPIAKELRKADLSVVNLETAITTGGDPAAKQFTFRAPASALAALEKSGVGVASMANNHGMDYGSAGLADSLAAIKKSRLPVIGIGRDENAAYRPFRVTLRGNRVAIIAATQVIDAEYIRSWTAAPAKAGLASAKNEARLLRAVRQARKNSDTVIVFLHWGTEMQGCPNAAQRALAPKLVRAGADVIVGVHAHRLLGGGYLGNAYVDYGLGNFVFYAWGPVTGKTGVLTLTINGRKVLKDRWTPAVIQPPGLPVPLTGAAAARAGAEWKRLRSCAGLADRPRDP